MVGDQIKNDKSSSNRELIFTFQLWDKTIVMYPGGGYIYTSVATSTKTVTYSESKTSP